MGYLDNSQTIAEMIRDPDSYGNNHQAILHLLAIHLNSSSTVGDRSLSMHNGIIISANHALRASHKNLFARHGISLEIYTDFLKSRADEWIEFEQQIPSITNYNHEFTLLAAMLFEFKKLSVFIQSEIDKQNANNKTSTFWARMALWLYQVGMHL